MEVLQTVINKRVQRPLAMQAVDDAFDEELNSRVSRAAGPEMTWAALTRWSPLKKYRPLEWMGVTVSLLGPWMTVIVGGLQRFEV